MHRNLRFAPKKFTSEAALWFLLGGLVFLYLHLFTLPCTPIYRVGDGLMYLQNAARMFEGQMIYRDFFQFTPPGTELVYFVLFKLFGPRAWIHSASLLLLGVSFIWLSIVISKQLMSGASALLPGLLFLTLAYRFWLDGTHHWFSALAAIAALAVVVKERNPARLAVAGALCGLALCFTQLRGVVAVLGLAVFLLWECRRQGLGWHSLLRNEGSLFGTFFATVVAFNIYFVWKIGLKRFLDCTVIFGIKYYPAFTEGNSLRIYFADLPNLHPWYPQLPRVGAYLFIHGILPLVYLLFFARYWREVRDRPGELWDRLMLLNIMGLFLFLGIAPAPNWLRLCSVSLPALILLVWLVNSPGKLHQEISRLLWAAALMLAIFEPLSRQVHWRAYLDASPGRTAFLNPEDYHKQLWIFQRTSRSEFLFEAEFPRMYFTLGLRNPAAVPFLTPTDYTRPEQVQEVVGALEKHRVRYVLWSVWLDLRDDRNPAGDHLGPLRAYLRTHYRVVKTFPDFEQVWERDD